ncbi:MAG: signal recognition particle protein [Synergistetes bacterium]|nr:signal recognition particle protein [Synergistota bacterium]MDW8192317.1 signal recognition particle protein [Synergistota bacterium]
MFEKLRERLEGVLSFLRKKGKLSEEDVDSALRQIRLALLEADVHYKVVKDILSKVRERALAQEVISSINPTDQVLKILYEEFLNVMRGGHSKLTFSSEIPSLFMLVGLQGSGKTTTVVKIANLLKKEGKKAILVAADVKRPAAKKQLEVLSKPLGFQVVSGRTPFEALKSGIELAKESFCEVVIVDSAGRLHVDEEMLSELKELTNSFKFHEVLLVVDSMMGQEALKVGSAFSEAVNITGVILTKLDGDSRGGAALSIAYVLGKPVKFVGVGERIDDIEPFYPDRMASRILGMGDLATLIERVSSAVEEEKARELSKKLKRAEFTMEDLLEYLRQMKSMGPLDQLLDMVPGFSKLRRKFGDINVDEKELKHIEAIILSMTPEERRKPEIIKGSRKRRIAMGSGTSVQLVNQVLRQYEEMKEMMKKLSKGGGRIKLPFF